MRLIIVSSAQRTNTPTHSSGRFGADGHEVRLLTRSASKARSLFPGKKGQILHEPFVFLSMLMSMGSHGIVA